MGRRSDKSRFRALADMMLFRRELDKEQAEQPSVEVRPPRPGHERSLLTGRLIDPSVTRQRAKEEAEPPRPKPAAPVAQAVESSSLPGWVRDSDGKGGSRHYDEKGNLVGRTPGAGEPQFSEADRPSYTTLYTGLDGQSHISGDKVMQPGELSQDVIKMIEEDCGVQRDDTLDVADPLGSPDALPQATLEGDPPTASEIVRGKFRPVRGDEVEKLKEDSNESHR